jgi:hypothetical protein
MKKRRSLNRKKNSLPQGTPFDYINCDISCQNNIGDFYSEYYEYNTDVISDDTLKNRIIETEQETNRAYLLLMVWFIITVIIVIITIVGVLSNELNNYILYVSLGSLIFIVFFIFKNVYKYFNV